MVEAERQLGINQFCYNHYCQNAANISDDGKDDGEGQNQYFLPQPILGQMNIDRGQHRHRRKRANTTATFRYLEIEASVSSCDGSTDSIEFN